MNIRNVKTYVQTYGRPQKEAILFLHGFTGTSSTWDEVFLQWKNEKYYVIVTDHIGHGKTDAPYEATRYTMDEQIKDLDTILQKLGVTSVRIVGYSMGGRIALSYAVRYPEKVKQLLLESTSPGLATEGERAARRKSDAALAERIEKEGVEAFAYFWENIPLFETQKRLPKEKRLRIRQERQSQRAKGLANSLRGIGTGSQPSLWNELHTLHMPITCIVGERDPKYVEIAQQMKKRNESVEIVEVPDTGHAIHVEKPCVFATIIKEQFLKLT